jgi:glycosyltransferase involved in cell wall biosynthesis
VNQLTFDARWLSSGIGTYTVNVLSRLKGCGDISVRALTLPQHRFDLERYCDRVDVVSASIYTVREQIQIPVAARRSPLLHVPHYNVPVFHFGPLLVSILDLTHILDEGYRHTLKSRLYARPMLQLAAKKADHIFTLSEYSKRQIQQILGVEPGKITVTYCGVSEQFKPASPHIARARLAKEMGLHGSYVLYVGNLKPHKNLPTLMRAYAKLATERGLEQKLLIVGDDPSGGPHLRELARELGIQQAVRFVEHVSSELLPLVYAGADLLVLPSFEEGFGLPVAEAMACGTPVIASYAASLPEVVGNAGVMFDPKRTEALMVAMADVLSSSALREHLRAAGPIQARRFDWQECAMRHYRVYQRYFSQDATHEGKKLAKAN